VSSEERPTSPASPTDTFGRRLARLREQAGLSQSAMARRIGASQSAVSQIEAGDRSPSYGMLVQLAEALGVGMPYLVGAEVEGLSPDERIHFARFRALPASGRRELDSYVEFLQDKYAKGTG
jgi:transcriptional regulator with XRE-family HTH domain